MITHQANRFMDRYGWWLIALLALAFLAACEPTKPGATDIVSVNLAKLKTPLRNTYGEYIEFTEKN